MNHLTLKQILLVALLLCWVALLIMAVANAFDARNAQMDARRTDLADVTDMAVSIFADYAEQAHTGKLSVDDAKQQAIARINELRYGTPGYLAIVRNDSVMIDHPMSPKLNGKDMSAFRDAKGLITLLARKKQLCKGIDRRTGWIVAETARHAHCSGCRFVYRGAAITYRA